MRAITDNIEMQMDRRGITPHRIEGYTLGQWVLMDYGDVIVHVFDEEKRRYYDLERLWIDAPRVGVEEEVQDNMGGKD